METNNTLGSIIGIIEHTCSTTSKDGQKVTINVKMDCSNASDADIRGWIASSLAILGQRPWRLLTADEMKQLNGMTFDARTIGQKVKSLSESASALLTSFNGQTKEQIMATLLKTNGMTVEKAELLADAMLM
jgi:hypothetical protein